MSSGESGFETNVCIPLFKELGYEYAETPSQATREALQKDSFIDAVTRLNNTCAETAERVYQEFTRIQEAGEVTRENNHNYKHLTTNGVQVEDKNGDIQTYTLIDFANPDANEFTVTTQYHIAGPDGAIRIPDMVVFINGIPITVLELKDATENAESLKSAYHQVTTTYVNDIEQLFYYNQIVCLLSPTKAQVGSYTADWEWFLPWKYITGESDTQNTDNNHEKPQYESLIKGLFDKHRLLDVLQDFILHDSQHNSYTPTYYQYYGVNKAVDRTLPKLTVNSKQHPAARKIGVVSHSQGSGKSLFITYYINKVQSESDETPLFVVLTDEETLDKQICNDVLSEFGFNPHRASSIVDLRQKIREKRNGGGIITSTIQKFQTDPDTQPAPTNKPNSTSDTTVSSDQHPVLNDRSDIVVISDEAHRSQDKNYGSSVREALPNASQIGFTATPIKIQEYGDITEKWFGEEISTYRVNQAQNDGAVLPVDYQNKAPKVTVNHDKLQEAFRERADGQEGAYKRGPEVKDILRSQDRIEEIATDVKNYFVKKQHEYDGNALFVAIDRETAVAYQRKLNAVFDNIEAIAVISDKESLVEDCDGLSEKELKERFKNPSDSFKIAVVVNKWTTGFNAPSMHTIFIDKPMRGHNIVQSVGRVNRVADGKEGCRIIDYIGIKKELMNAFEMYNSTDIDSPVNVGLDKHVTEFNANVSKLDSIVSFDEYNAFTTEYSEHEKNTVINTELEQIDTPEKREYVSVFDELIDIYRRIHPCEKTESTSEMIEFFTMLAGRIKSLLSDKEVPNTDSSIETILQKSIEAEDAVQIDRVSSSDVIDSISNPDIEVNRHASGVTKKIEDQDAHYIASFEQIQSDVESIVEKYNEGRITGEDAVNNIREKAEEIDKIEQRAEALGISVEQVAFYDVLDTNVNCEGEQLVELTTTIHGVVSELVCTDWHQKEKVQAEMQNKLIDELTPHTDDFDQTQEATGELIEQAKEIY